LWILLGIVGGTVYGSQLEIPLIMASSLAFVGLVILPIWWLSRDRVRSRLAARSQVQIEIMTAASDPRDQDQAPEIAVRIAQTRPRHLFAHSNTWEQETAASWPNPARHVQGCRAAAQTLPEPLMAALTDLIERLRRRDLAIELRVERALQSIPWEAVLGFTTPATSVRQRTGQLRFWRAGPLEGPVEQRQGVRCLCDARWGLLAERAWRGLREPLHLDDDLTDVSDAAPARVLHIVGTPIDTGAGMHLKVGGTGQPDTGQRIDALGREEGLLLRPDKLPLDRYSLVVVQEEPVEGVTRLEAEREQTADVRAWAAELVEAGAQAVVLLPAQPAEVAELAIGRLARWLAARSTNWRGLIDAVADVRMAIADATTPSNGSGGRGLLGRRIDEARKQEWSETQLELALEVTVFAPTAGRRESGG
jgi:hypothetical protein